MSIFYQDISECENIGDKLEDFELLTILGEGSFGVVLKVQSLINHEIYAMKIINLDNIDEKMKEYIESEIEMLKKLSHKNIVKYYTHFVEENTIYIIMEYLVYGDLSNYIDLLIHLYENNKDIINNKKLEIIYIFLQCITALQYLNDLKIIHRDIKPENIFISEIEGIKIGDFGVAAKMKDKDDINTIIKLKQNTNTIVGSEHYMSPEILAGKEYNEKTDIYSMGLIFYKLYFLKDYRTEEWNIKDDRLSITFSNQPKPDNNKDPIIDFIFSMIEDDFNKRPDINILFEQINNIYMDYTSKNNISSLFAVIRCLSNYPYLKNFFKNKFHQKNKIYSEKFYQCIMNTDSLVEALLFYKEKYCEENNINFFDINKEIKPYFILNYILDKMNKELLNLENKTNENYQSKNTNYENSSGVLHSKFKQDFSNSFNSKISNNFSCIMKIFYQCLNCKYLSHNYSNFFSLSFNLKTFLSKNSSESKEINIIDLFKYQNDITLTLSENFTFYCLKCKKEQRHQEKKMFYYLPYCLVINLDYTDVNNYNKMNYPEKLDLSLIEKGLSKVSAKKYSLIGIIKNIKGYYISILFDYDNEHKWFLFENDKKIILPNFKEHNSGRVEMLFYCSEDKK